MNNIYVVASDSGGHREIVDASNGFLTKKFDTESLLGKLENIFKKLGKKNKVSYKNDKFFQKFKNKNFINKIENVYLH